MNTGEATARWFHPVGPNIETDELNGRWRLTGPLMSCPLPVSVDHWYRSEPQCELAAIKDWMEYLETAEGRTAAWFLEYSKAANFSTPGKADDFWFKYLARPAAAQMVALNATAKANYFLAKATGHSHNEV